MSGEERERHPQRKIQTLAAPLNQSPGSWPGLRELFAQEDLNISYLLA